jgi:hypothetical protein
MRRRSPALSLPARLFDQAGDAFQFLIGNRAFRPEHRGDDFLGRSLEERVEEVFQRGLPDRVGRGGRKVDVPKSLLFVPDIA